MVLNEQILKKQKLYFHGSKQETLDKASSHYDWFFITVDITNAILYCKQTEDEIKYIHTFKLKKPLNIFNAKSKIDYERLRRALLKEGKLDFVNNEMFLIRDNDWSQMGLASGMTREDLVSAIESLGYDGFFNFEWDKDKGHSNEQFSKPSIGIFGDIKDKLEYLGVQPLKSFKSFKYDEIHQSDLNQLRHSLSQLAGISASEEVFNQKVEEFFAAYNKWFSTLTKADFTNMAKGMYKRMSKSELFENILKYNEVKNRKAKELGINIPRNI